MKKNISGINQLKIRVYDHEGHYHPGASVPTSVGCPLGTDQEPRVPRVPWEKCQRRQARCRSVPSHLRLASAPHAGHACSWKGHALAGWVTRIGENGTGRGWVTFCKEETPSQRRWIRGAVGPRWRPDGVRRTRRWASGLVSSSTSLNCSWWYHWWK